MIDVFDESITHEIVSVDEHYDTPSEFTDAGGDHLTLSMLVYDWFIAKDGPGKINRQDFYAGIGIHRKRRRFMAGEKDSEVRVRLAEHRANRIVDELNRSVPVLCQFPALEWNTKVEHSSPLSGISIWLQCDATCAAHHPEAEGEAVELANDARRSGQGEKGNLTIE